METKTTVYIFLATNRRYCIGKDLDLVKKGKLQERKMNIFLSQHKTMSLVTIKAKINNPQRNGKCRLCGERDEMINHIINE